MGSNPKGDDRIRLESGYPKVIPTEMDPTKFLAGLPALLGLAGFVVYQLLGANKAGDEITSRILDKLRRQAPDSVPLDKRLTPKQMVRLLETHQRLRAMVDDREFFLLEQALKQQFILNISVYFLTVGFCGWSMYLFTRSPEPAPTTTNQTSKGVNSPNVVSNGSGAVTVNIEGQPPASKPETPSEKKK